MNLDLKGCGTGAILQEKEVIRQNIPHLAVSVSNIASDIWEASRLITYINPGYQFALRCYQREDGWRKVLYGIPSLPEEREENVKNRQKERGRRVVALAPYGRGWSNVELVKDCGLIPYLLYKNHGCDVTMAGAEGDEYPYLETCVKGLKMEFLEDGTEASKIRYITRNAADIDCLILRGCYPTNYQAAKTYKFLNPSGVIYVGLDANSHWMDRILWEDEQFKEFMDCCDVIATSCQAMQEHLNRKWPWKIECIPNGFYDFSSGQPKDPCFDEKEDVILTAGRLGTEQKATHVLLEAFAMIEDELPQWKLRLAGTVDKGFEGYVDQYFERFPHLKDRVTFLGPIQDREVLRKEYLRAKIFALPSLWEGGTPNVIGEALNAGYVTAVTRFDAYEDATDHGRCGMDTGLGDIAGFSDILVRLCSSGRLREMSRQAYEYGSTHLNIECIVARLHKMLFEGKS